MKKIFFLLSLLQMSLLFSGCEFIGDIFKAGIWVGIIIIIAIIAVVAFVIRLFSK